MYREEMAMDSLSPKLDSDVLTHHLTPETPHTTPKKRKVVQKTVVTVKMGTKKAGKLKNEGPPPDFWSWRKYGQKPIKGSPYPRGYYRCSTSKGCSAKKQVERSKADGSMFIITYTSSHNHPGPSISTLSFTHQAEEIQSQPSDQILPNQEEEGEEKEEDHDEKEDHHYFHYIQSPLNCSKEISVDQEEDPLTEELEKPVEKIRACLDEEISFSSATKSEENDFFDELEELPTPPSFSSLMRSYHFDEIRISVAPS